MNSIWGHETEPARAAPSGQAGPSGPLWHSRRRAMQRSAMNPPLSPLLSLSFASGASGDGNKRSHSANSTL